MNERRGLAAALVFFAVLYFLLNLNRSFWIANEGYYSLGAQSVLRGDWLVPTIHPAKQVDKPPLFYWWVALVSAPLGETPEWSARLANLFPSLIGLAVVFAFARRRLGVWEAWLALFFTGLCAKYWDVARSVSTDMALTALLAGAWVLMFGLLTGHFAWRRWAGFWALLGLGMLTKGPVALVLSGLIAAMFSFWTFGGREGWRRLWALRPIRGVAVSMGLFGLWAAAVYFRHGWDTFHMLIIEHNFIRFLDAESVSHAKPWWYFIREAPVVLLPWSLLSPFLAVWLWRRRAETAPGDQIARYALCVCVAVFLFFSISESKRDYYILPLVPWYCLLAAQFVAARMREAGLGGPVANWRAALRALRRFRLGNAVVWFGALTLAHHLAFSLVVTPLLEPRKSPKIIARAIEESIPGDHALVILEEEDARILYYIKRPFDFVDEKTEDLNRLEQRLGSGERLALLVEDGNLRDVKKMAVPLYLKREALFHNDSFYIILNHSEGGTLDLFNPKSKTADEPTGTGGESEAVP